MDYLLGNLTAGQLAEWQAYDSLDPFGEWRADFRIASLEAFIQNLMTRSKKPAVPLDFMPDWANEFSREPEQMSVEQIKSKLMGLVKAQNKRVPVPKPKNNSSKTTKK